MTFPLITADGQIYTPDGGVSYTSLLAQNRWKRFGIGANRVPGAVTTVMIAGGAVAPDKTNFATTPVTAPPGSPSTATLYRIIATATDAFAGKENQLARYDGTTWFYTVPYEGLLIWDAPTNKLLGWDGTAWSEVNGYTLPVRLGTTATLITDWNTALENGYYRTDPSLTNNGPSPHSSLTAVYGEYIGVSALNGSQVVYVYDDELYPSTTRCYRRDQGAGVWGAWYQVGFSEAEVQTIVTAAVGAAANEIKFTVLDRDLTAPPATPTIGDIYLVKPVATGAWAGHDHQIAEWTATGWVFTTPVGGAAIWVEDESVLLYYAEAEPQSLGAIIENDPEAIGIVALNILRPLRPTVVGTSVTAIVTGIPSTGILDLYASSDAGATFTVVASGSNGAANFAHAFSSASSWQFFTRVRLGARNGPRSEIATYTTGTGGTTGGDGGLDYPPDGG